MSKKNQSSASSNPGITRADLAAAVVPQDQRQSAALSLFQDTGAFQLPTGAIVKAMSPMIKPIDFPIGKVLVGAFTRLFKTEPGKNDDGSVKIGTGIEIIPAGSKVGIALPAVATLALALEIEGKGNEAKSPYLGRTIAVQKLADKIPSKKGNAAWNFLVAIYPAV